jgi:hypothetical protein
MLSLGICSTHPPAFTAYLGKPYMRLQREKNFSETCQVGWHLYAGLGLGGSKVQETSSCCFYIVHQTKQKSFCIPPPPPHPMHKVPVLRIELK